MNNALDINRMIVISKKMMYQPENKDNLQLYNQMKIIISDHRNLSNIFQHLHLSKQFMMTTFNILRNQIKNGNYVPQLTLLIEKRNTNLLQPQKINLEHRISQYKLQIYWKIIEQLYNLVTFNPIQKYIQNSCRDLIAVCLKSLINDNQDLKFFEQFLKLFFKGFELNQDFLKKSNEQITVKEHLVSEFPTNYIFYIQVLVSFLDDIMHGNLFKNYYQYRRYIYFFRTNFLSQILQLIIFYLKLYFRQISQNINSLKTISKFLFVTIKLFELVITYPFSLTLHEFQHEPDYQQRNINELFFPGYFRNITCDLNFMKNLYEFYLYQNENASTNQQFQEQILLLRIIARLISANSFFFMDQNQKMIFRRQAVNMVNKMIISVKDFSYQFIDHFIDIIFKIIVSYTRKQYGEQFHMFMDNILNLCYKIAQFSQINLQIRQNNPTSRMFELLKYIWSQLDSDPLTRKYNRMIEEVYPTEKLKIYYQQILQKYLTRILNQNEVEKIMNFKHRNFKKQVKIFYEIFKYIPYTIKQNYELNINFLYQLSLQNLSYKSQNIWIYLCITLFSDSKKYIKDQAKLVLKIFYFIKSRNCCVCNLNFIESISNHLLTDLNKDESTTSLWIQIKQIIQQSPQIFGKFTFIHFVNSMIQECLRSLNINNYDIIDYSLEILKTIFMRIKRHYRVNDEKSFSIFFDLLKIFISNIQNSIFQLPENLKKRIFLYQMIAVVWIQGNQVKPIYEIYLQITKNLLSNMSKINLLKYLYDVTGVIGSIQSNQNYRVFTQLILQDLPSLISTFFNQKNIKQNLQQPQIRKAFIKMSQALLKDLNRRMNFQIHNDIPLKIHYYLTPIIKICAQYPYSKRLLYVFTKLIDLNPLAPILSLPNRSLCKKQSECQTLFYQLAMNTFENLRRYLNIKELYVWIKQNVQYMYLWWQQMISRKQNIQINNFSDIIQSRLWQSKKQQQMMGKILYMAGNYNIRYRVYPHLFQEPLNEQIFVKRFIEYTKKQ